MLAFQTQIAGDAVLHLSDCACVVKAIEDGSVKIKMLQDQAIEIWELTTKFGMLFYSMWVPSDRVIELGADALSRDEGLDWGGYTADAKMWQAVQGLRNCALLQWTFSRQVEITNARASSCFTTHTIQKVWTLSKRTLGSVPSARVVLCTWNMFALSRLLNYTYQHGAIYKGTGLLALQSCQSRQAHLGGQ